MDAEHGSQAAVPAGSQKRSCTQHAKTGGMLATARSAERRPTFPDTWMISSSSKHRTTWPGKARAVKCQAKVTTHRGKQKLQGPKWCNFSCTRRRHGTWQMASVVRMLFKKALPMPSPLLAPFTRPAMSTNSTVAGTWGQRTHL
jgi:hypothetical protein